MRNSDSISIFKNTKIILVAIILILVSSYTAYSQSQFQRAIGGTGIDYGYSIVQTTDGGCIVVGNTNSFGSDMYIVKINENGTVQWIKTVGGSMPDQAYCIIQTTDGGYIVGGLTASFGAYSSDMYVVKLDVSGTVQWSKAVNNNEDCVKSIIQTADGGYAAVGYTYQGQVMQMYIVKFDSVCTVQWSKSIGGTGSDVAYSIIQTTDSGFVVAGYTNSYGAGSNDMYIVKLDNGGTVLWSKTAGGTGSDVANSIKQTSDGGFVVAGNTNSYGAGLNDMYIVKLDTGFTIQWSKTVGGTGSDGASSIVQTSDGGYVVTGSTSSFGAGSSDMYIVKLDNSGMLQWSKTVGGTGSDVANSIIQTTNGGYALFGSTSSFGAGNSDMYIVKFDSNWITCGNTTSPQSISGTGGSTSLQTSTVILPGSPVNSPTPVTNTGGTVTNICTLVGIQPQLNEIPDSFVLYQNYPNPFNPSTVISYQLPVISDVVIKVFDVQGREVETLVNERLQAGSYQTEWNASSYPSGVYFYRITTDAFSETKKMFLIK